MNNNNFNQSNIFSYEESLNEKRKDYFEFKETNSFDILLNMKNVTKTSEVECRNLLCKQILVELIPCCVCYKKFCKQCIQPELNNENQFICKLCSDSVNNFIN